MLIFKSGKKSIVSYRETLTSILKEMERKDAEIEGSIIVRTDGLILATALPEDIDGDIVAAMSASVFGVGARVLEELGGGTLENAIIRGSNRIIMLVSVTPEVSLVAIAQKDANLGLMFVEMKRAADKIREVLKKI
ncbi:MAG: roadblock/LC7 domain-containing protein [Candidatus Baldrarchaeia archaeon]